MAKDYVESLMGDNERTLVVERQHWFVLFSSIFLEIVLLLVIIAVVGTATFFYTRAALGFILLLVPFVGMLRDILRWNSRRYIITNFRVIQVTGVFSKQVVDSSLEKVNDVKMSQSFFGRIFGYGDIEILTASELGVNLFRRIAEPIKFKTAMLNAKERLGFDGMAGRPRADADIPSMISELDALRKQGVLSEAEFERKKAELMAKM
jgi:membrane protein YdbS with pleckstrin-like domain